MIEKKVAKIIELQDAVAKINLSIAECDIAKQSLMNDRFKVMNDLAIEKNNLGQAISPISQNIIVEINNKLYCAFFNRKYNTGGVIEAISAKDAELKLCINKMEMIK